MLTVTATLASGKVTATPAAKAATMAATATTTVAAVMYFAWSFNYNLKHRTEMTPIETHT